MLANNKITVSAKLNNFVFESKIDSGENCNVILLRERETLKKNTMIVNSSQINVKPAN